MHVLVCKSANLVWDAVLPGCVSSRCYVWAKLVFKFFGFFTSAWPPSPSTSFPRLGIAPECEEVSFAQTGPRGAPDCARCSTQSVECVETKPVSPLRGVSVALDWFVYAGDFFADPFVLALTSAILFMNLPPVTIEQRFVADPQILFRSSLLPVSVHLVRPMF